MTLPDYLLFPGLCKTRVNLSHIIRGEIDLLIDKVKIKNDV